MYASKAKYFAVVRHGERVDEVERGTQELDPQLTPTGLEESFKTGYNLMKLLLESGWSSQHGTKVRFLSSVMWRCVQTLDQLRGGMEDYCKEHLPSEDGLLQRIRDEKTYIEEAFTERNVKEPASYYDETRYLKDQAQFIADFSRIHAVPGGFFDYSSQDLQKFVLRRTISSAPQQIKLLQNLHVKTINRLIHDAEAEVYVVVGHGQLINKLQTYLKLKCDSYPLVHYNGLILLKLDLSKHKKHFDDLNAFEPVPLVYNKRIVEGSGKQFNKAAYKIGLKKDKKETGFLLRSDPQAQDPTPEPQQIPESPTLQPVETAAQPDPQEDPSAHQPAQQSEAADK